MKNINLSIISVSIFSMVLSASAMAEPSKNDILKNLFGEPVAYSNPAFTSGNSYTGDNGVQNYIIYFLNGSSGNNGFTKKLNFAFMKRDPNEYGTGWYTRNVTINGETPSWTTEVDSNYPTLDFDENGKLQAQYNSSGQLTATYEYAEDGQMLVYNPQGELLGAYDNFYDNLMTGSPYYDRKSELNHLNEDGEYVAKNEDKILAVYKPDGSIDHPYKYDGGGNITAIYENGIATFRRTSYTPAEAAAAIKKGNNNKVTLTFK